MKLTEAFDKYIDEVLWFQKKSRMSIEHYQLYKRSLATILGDIELASLGLNDVRQWEEELMKTRCQNTLRSYVGGLKQVLKYSKIMGYDCIDSALIICPQRIPKTVSYVTAEEVRQMIECSTSARTKFVVSFLFASGVRVSEAVSLNICDIRNRQFTVIGKGNKERLCFIDKRTEDLMYAYLNTRTDHSEALFASYLLGDRVSVSTIQQIVKNAVIRAGIHKKISPHTFRHGHATNLIKNGADIRYVAQDLGHSNLSNTMIYTHIEDPDLREKYEKYHKI